MSKTITFKPNSQLLKYIDRFYLFEKSSPDYFELPAVLPGTGLELIFHIDEPLVINKKTLSKAHTVCPRKLFYFEKTKHVNFLAVRFKSGAFRHFCTTPFATLNNNYFSVENLWPETGIQLLNTLKNTDAIELKIEHISSFLQNAFNYFHNPKNDLWDSIINDLYYNFENTTILDCANKMHLSLRQFERGFKAQFGITAKAFQKLARFQDAVKKTLLNKTPDYLNTILDNGYFDQSHFIKEFKTLTQQVPLKYFKEENFSNHFYHKSIKVN